MGCTEEGACNYNPNATTDDGSCVFDDGIYGCDGECISDADGDGICDQNEVGGCTDTGACNFDEFATDDDGSCEYESCAGCTDATACNYDETATIEDSSCFFPGEACDDMIDATEGDVVQEDCSCLGYSCYDETACNYSTEGIEDNTLCSYIRQYVHQPIRDYRHGTNELRTSAVRDLCVTETNANAPSVHLHSLCWKHVRLDHGGWRHFGRRRHATLRDAAGAWSICNKWRNVGGAGSVCVPAKPTQRVVPAKQGARKMF